MIAEIYNKISQSGSNLHERLEDKLTGDVFGALRYIPFESGLKPILSRTLLHRPVEQQRFAAVLSQCSGYDYNITFWKKGRDGEIDMVLETGQALIGIEVKYISGLSSDDDIDLSEEEKEAVSINQLGRYSRYIGELAINKAKFLLFLAPASMGVAVVDNVQARNILHLAVPLGLLTWQEVLLAACEAADTVTDTGQKRVLGDIRQLLTKKGFEPFRGFASGLEAVQLPSASCGYMYRKNKSIQWNSYGTVGKIGEAHYEYRG
ncbi:hypothetical protein [Aneurinibacillus sp. REN35]|uniref:hypothetical protein n=1 Tax=Aneurinibacillus sp. REN35 TaxID=3237286 RepID=UPI003526E34A